MYSLRGTTCNSAEPVLPAIQRALGQGSCRPVGPRHDGGLRTLSNQDCAWLSNPSPSADQRENEVAVDYRPRRHGPAVSKGMWLRVRSARVDQQGANQLDWQVRVILNRGTRPAVRLLASQSPSGLHSFPITRRRQGTPCGTKRGAIVRSTGSLDRTSRPHR
jgi:hypothetical protein